MVHQRAKLYIFILQLYEELLAENEKLRQKIMELEDQDKKRENEFNREKRVRCVLCAQQSTSERKSNLKSKSDIHSEGQYFLFLKLSDWDSYQSMQFWFAYMT